MAIVAGTDKDGKRMTSHCVTAYGVAGLITRTCQMTINALHVSFDMDAVGEVLGPICVATGTQGISGSGSASLLRMYLVTVHTSHIHFAVAACLPFKQRASVTRTTQVFGPSDQHILLRVLGAIGPVACLTGDAGQHKLTGDRIVAGGVAGKTFTRFFRLLQIDLKDRIK
jgi:hypothetical protein